MSSGCGLKNSGCPSNDDGPSASPDTPPGRTENDETTMRRFIFVDGKTGAWSTLEPYAPEIVCPVGSIVVFHYPATWHDVVALPSQQAFDACDISNVTVLSPFALPDSAYPDVSYYYPCSEPGNVAYLTCSVPGHCEAGQKIRIRTSASEFAWDPLTQAWILHVQSIPRLLRLLNYREGDDGLFIMDHGYQTEALAEQTLELIWCALDHCPGPALAFDPDASVADCESMIYTLMGFVSRKRPIPQYDKATQYYYEAIARGGSNACAAQSYLTQLYWSRGPYYAEEAQNQTLALCQACAASDPLLVRQAKQEYDRQNFGTWPAKECDTVDVASSAMRRLPWLSLVLLFLSKALLW